MEFRVLGPLEVAANNGPLILGTRKQRTLLAILLCHLGRRIPRETLLDLLWSDPLPRSAGTNLRVYVSQLRRMVGDHGKIHHDRGGYLLQLDAGLVDARRFEHLADDAERACRYGRTELARAGFDQALRLWRGPAFQEFDEVLPLRDEAARLGERRLVALERRIDLDLAAGRHAELIAELVPLVRAHPFREQLRLKLMLALYRSGRQAEALRVFAEGRRAMVDELGIEPGRSLSRLAHRVLTGDPVLDEPAGQRQIVRVAGRSALPRDLPDFTGRDREVAALCDTAGRGNRILAINGMAGVGKTALAVHVAHRLTDAYPVAQLHVDLCGHHVSRRPLHPEQALQLLLRGVGVPAAEIPGTLDERVARWRTESAGLRGLLVLDDAVDTAQIEPLLPGSEGCLTIVTSRRRLMSLDGSRPMTLDVLDAEAATELLGRLAGASWRDAEPAAVAEVARLCGYLPLAIRIAGAQLLHRPACSAAELADLLANPRQRLARLCADGRSVAGAIHRSYQALPREGRWLFRLLGRHAGAEICPRAVPALGTARARSLLDDLVDANLLSRDRDGRYHLHELVAAYATELAGPVSSPARPRCRGTPRSR